MSLAACYMHQVDALSASLKIALALLDKIASWDDQPGDEEYIPTQTLEFREDARETLKKIRGGDGRPPKEPL